MIRVKIELVPYGEESAARRLDDILIANDKTGSESTGNYEARSKTLSCRVRGHYRMDGAIVLLGRVMEKFMQHKYYLGSKTPLQLKLAKRLKQYEATEASQQRP